MNSIYDIQTLEKLIRDPYQRRKFLNATIKKALPPKECPEPASEFSSSLEMIERHDSKTDGATKLVFSCSGGTAASPSTGFGGMAASPSAGIEADAPPKEHRVEAVILRIASGRTSLCISSQIGCAADCQFCATGAMGFIRNLTFDEMLDQVLLAKRLLRDEGRTLRNVVVMGMGEPLHNEANLFQCLEILRDPRFFNLSENHLMVSTVGVPDAMVRFVERFPGIQLALSLHSARQEVREKLMPVGKFQTLEKLKAVFPMVGKASGFMIEYLMLKGFNDGPEDLETLKEFLRGTNAHINLIQFNAHPGAKFQPVTLEERKAFGEALKAAGFKVTLRYSLGDDIAAACGQLGKKDER